jgi:hypothetical protein
LKEKTKTKILNEQMKCLKILEINKKKISKIKETEIKATKKDQNCE